jgi:hypothetical protein
MTQTIRNNWRIAPWVVIALVLAVPLVAMQFTDEVRWTGWDFLAAGALLGGAALVYERGVRRITGRWQRIAAAGALVLAVALLWAAGAGGIFS